jgi:hypothetical protein
MEDMDMYNPLEQTDAQDQATAGLSRRLLMLLGAFYVALLIATVLDAIYGQSLIAPWSLTLVCTGTIAMLGCSRLFVAIETLESWLWQLARCSALAGLVGAIIGLTILFLGNGSFQTMTTGLSLAAFSVLYGVLIAMPAGCMVVLDNDASN